MSANNSNTASSNAATAIFNHFMESKAAQKPSGCAAQGRTPTARVLVIAAACAATFEGAATAASTASPATTSSFVHTSDVLRLQTLGLLDNIELNAFSFVERTEPLRLDLAVMNENVRATILLDEAVALFLREPLDLARAACHG